MILIISRFYFAEVKDNVIFYLFSFIYDNLLAIIHDNVTLLLVNTADIPLNNRSLCSTIISLCSSTKQKSAFFNHKLLHLVFKT